MTHIFSILSSDFLSFSLARRFCFVMHETKINFWASSNSCNLWHKLVIPSLDPNGLCKHKIAFRKITSKRNKKKVSNYRLRGRTHDSRMHCNFRCRNERISQSPKMMILASRTRVELKNQCQCLRLILCASLKHKMHVNSINNSEGQCRGGRKRKKPMNERRRFADCMHKAIYLPPLWKKSYRRGNA